MESSEKFILRWDGFTANTGVIFRELREKDEFSDLTLVSGDGKQVRAHQVILAGGSSFVYKILRGNPLIEEDLNDFLDIAEDLKVKGLTRNGELGKTDNKQSKSRPTTPGHQKEMDSLRQVWHPQDHLAAEVMSQHPVDRIECWVIYSPMGGTERIYSSEGDNEMINSPRRVIVAVNEAIVVRMKMTGLQLLFVALLSTPVIVAEDLDPVEFLISKNYPRNITLIPLPKDFDKFGDQKNDCCALQLFFEVKDYKADGTGNGDGYSDNESQTETGSVTFNFEHPEIRKSDIKFTMSVEKDKDKVKSKHLLNFDNCTNIMYKTFNISATTTIVDVKDVRVVLVNGKDQKIVCSDPNLAPDPREDQPDNINEYLFIKLEEKRLALKGWITNIRKNNKPLFFSGVITCCLLLMFAVTLGVWCVLGVITAGIMLLYILLTQGFIQEF